jgi:hypothetical protein
MAVRACSPPESSASDCSRLPGGRAKISRPGFQRIFRLGEGELGFAAFEQL